MRKIPTLLVDDLTIIDSDNICFYLDSISNKKTLFPKDDYFKIISMVSVANGLMESVLERRMEIIRPIMNKVKILLINKKLELKELLNGLKNNWKNYNEDYLTMDQITIACSLEYTNFRLNNQWEKNSPNLIEMVK